MPVRYNFEDMSIKCLVYQVDDKIKQKKKNRVVCIKFISLNRHLIMFCINFKATFAVNKYNLESMKLRSETSRENLR